MVSDCRGTQGSRLANTRGWKAAGVGGRQLTPRDREGEEGGGANAVGGHVTAPAYLPVGRSSRPPCASPAPRSAAPHGHRHPSVAEPTAADRRRQSRAGIARRRVDLKLSRSRRHRWWASQLRVRIITEHLATAPEFWLAWFPKPYSNS